MFPSQLDGITCFSGSPNDDEASQPLQCFDKNLFVFCRVSSELIAVSEQYNSSSSDNLGAKVLHSIDLNNKTTLLGSPLIPLKNILTCQIVGLYAQLYFNWFF